MRKTSKQKNTQQKYGRNIKTFLKLSFFFFNFRDIVYQFFSQHQEKQKYTRNNPFFPIEKV